MNGNYTAKTPRDPLDFYPTPPEVTGVLRDWLYLQFWSPPPEAHFLDPASGEGHIACAMREKWPEVEVGDIEVITDGKKWWYIQ